jgi:Hint domain
MSRIISGNNTSQIKLTNTADNPATVTGTINVGTGHPSLYSSALVGNASVNWAIYNQGLIEAATIDGVQLQGFGDLTNAGTIIGYDHGFYNKYGGSVFNEVGGTIAGYLFGVVVSGDNVAKSVPGTVTNAGTITFAHNSYSGRGVLLGVGGSVTNLPTGLIEVDRNGVDIYNAAGSLTNAGTIEAVKTSGIGVVLSGSVSTSSEYLSNTGLIEGGLGGVRVALGLGTIFNQSVIEGISTYGFNATDGATVFNGSGATIATGGFNGVQIWNGPRSVFNQGLISATKAPTGFFYGANRYGINLTTGTAGPTPGYVSNAASGTIIGVSGVGIGGANGVVLNAGTIESTILGGYSVLFWKGHANYLKDEPGAAFIGVVNGGNTIGATAISTLELMSAASTGTLSGIGYQYINFGQITVASGASWVWGGTNSISSGATLTNDGTLELLAADLTDDGVLVNNGLVNLDPSTAMLASLIGTGSLDVGVGSTLQVAAVEGTAHLNLGTGADSISVVQNGNSAVLEGLGAVGGSAVLTLGTAASAATLTGGGTQPTTVMAGTGADTLTVVQQGGSLAVQAADSGDDPVNLSLFGGIANLNLGTGADTVSVGQGNSTVGVFGMGAAGGSATVNVGVGAGAATIQGGNTGATTITAGTGAESISVGVTNGPAVVRFGSAAALLTLGGTADPPLDIIYTGSGAETLMGGGSADVDYVFTSGGTPNVVIDNLNIASDTISLLNFPGDEATNLMNNAMVSDGSTYVTLSDGTQITFANVTSLNGLQISDSVLCFAAGTRITTPTGERPVETFAVGDMVATRISGENVPIVWIGRRTVNCRRHPLPESVWPVRIAAGAFGSGLPTRDLWLSPDHAVFIDDVLIPAKHLIDEEGLIIQVPMDGISYYHVELPRHDVLLAEGLAVESYLDTGSRANFTNGGGPVALHPDFAPSMWEAAGCAPLVVTGPRLDAVRRRLREIAALASPRPAASLAPRRRDGRAA